MRFLYYALLLSLCAGAIPPPALPATMSVARPTVLRQIGPVADAAALQAALDSSLDGDEILLSPGVTYATSNVFAFTLKRRNNGVGNGWVIIRTAGISTPVGDRVTRNLNLAKLKYSGASPDASLVLGLANEGPQTAYWMGYRFEFVEFVGVNGQRRIISLFSDRTVPTNPLPSGFVFDSVWIHPTSDTDENSYGLVTACNSVALINSIIEEIHAGAVLNQESKCFSTSEGTGPYKIDNNYLSCASMSILIGGADPANPANVPSDFTITRNYLFKPLSWQGGATGGPWFTIKNHFEMKTGKRVLFEGNICENAWKDLNPAAPNLQHGYSWVLWSTGNPAETAHLTMRNNIIINTDRAFSMSIVSTAGAVDMHDVLVENLSVEDGAGIGDTGDRMFQLNGGVNNLVVRDSSFFLAPAESCMFFNGAVPPTGRSFEGTNILCATSIEGIGGKPISNTYESATFTNCFALDTGTCATKYTTGWTCGTTAPGGVGADMAQINLATGNRVGVTTGVWSSPTTTVPPTTTTVPPTTTTVPPTTTTVPPTTTTVPPMTTTPAAMTTGAPTTTGAGGSTATTPTIAASTTPAQTTAAPTTTTTRAATTTPLATTTVPATTTTTTAATAAPTTTTPSACPNGPRVCCVFDPLPMRPNFVTFNLRLNAVFADFDCVSFRKSLAGEMQVPETEIAITSCTSGSVVVDGGADPSSVATFSSTVQSGTSSLPVITFSSGGTSVSPPAPFPWWIIVVAVIGGVLLIATIIIIIVCVRRNKGLPYHQRPSVDYIALK